MSLSKIVLNSGVAVDISQVKCFNLGAFTDLGKTKKITIELKQRFEYIRNPANNEWEKQEYNEKVEILFPSYDIASAHLDEWIAIWQYYLDTEEELKNQ